MGGCRWSAYRPLAPVPGHLSPVPRPLAPVPRDLPPFECSTSARVQVAHAQHQEEAQHRDDAGPAKIAQNYGPRVEEQRLDVEDQKQHADQRKTNWPAGFRGDRLRDATLIWPRFGVAGQTRRQPTGQHQHQCHEQDGEREVSDQWWRYQERHKQADSATQVTTATPPRAGTYKTV